MWAARWEGRKEEEGSLDKGEEEEEEALVEPGEETEEELVPLHATCEVRRNTNSLGFQVGRRCRYRSCFGCEI